MLDEGLSLDRLRDTLRRKRAELELNARLVEPRLERVEARLWQIELEGTMPDYENNIKELPPLRVASVRGIILTYPQQGQLWAELEKEMRRQGVRSAGACFTRYLDSEYRDRNIQAGVCYRILGECADRGQMAVRELPGGSTSTTDP